MRKTFISLAIIFMLMPAVSFGATTQELENQRIDLMKQLIVLLEARVQHLMKLLEAQHGVVLGAATSTVSNSTSTATTSEVMKKKRRGGGGGSRRNDESVLTAEELQQQLTDLVVTINGILEEDEKTFGYCQWIDTTGGATVEGLQTQISQLLLAIEQLQNGATEINGCPLLDVEPAFATSTASLRFALGSGSPDSTDIIVDDEDITYDVTLLEYTIEAKGGDASIDTLFIDLVTGAADVSAVVNGIGLYIDSVIYEFDENVSWIDANTSSFGFNTHGSMVIASGTKKTVQVFAQFNPQSGNYLNGETVQVRVSGDVADQTIATSQGTIVPEQIDGSATGDVHTLVSAGIVLPTDGVETITETLGTNDTVGVFAIEFEVAAVEGDFYITDNVAASTSASDGVTYEVSGGSATTSATLSSTADEDTAGVFTVKEGETETFTLTVTVDPLATGAHRVTLTEVNFSASTNGTSNIQVYLPTPASDYRTAYLTIQGD